MTGRLLSEMPSGLDRRAESAAGDGRFSSILIGEGTLPLQCADVLWHLGYPIAGIVASDAALQRWAEERAIPCADLAVDLLAFLRHQPFDYLFSIVNYRILPPAVLALPRQGAINYHDSLLPRYAGVHATSWALMQGEKFHGVTWHAMGETVDTGAILKQESFAVADRETAFTLNAKCYEAAIRSFTELVAELAAGRVAGEPQNAAQRTYFPRRRRPPAGGVLCWRRGAREIDALVRALDFGPYANPLGLPKIALGSEFLIVTRVEPLDLGASVLPGTITHIGKDALRISTGRGQIALQKLLTMEGQPLSISQVVSRYSLREGLRLPDLDPGQAERITRTHEAIGGHEPFWSERLASFRPAALPGTTRQPLPQIPAGFECQRMPLPDSVTRFLAERSSQWALRDFLLTAFVGFLARMTGSDRVELGYSPSELRRQLAGLEAWFAGCVPLAVEIDSSLPPAALRGTVREAVAQVEQHQSYARDLVARDPGLRRAGAWTRGRHHPVVVQTEPALGEPLEAGEGDLTLVIPEAGSECGWVWNAATVDRAGAAAIIRRFATFLEAIAAEPDRPVADVGLLFAEERRQLLTSWNETRRDYPRDRCLHELLEAQVARTPEATAVIGGEERLSYAALNARADRWACALRALGVGPEVRVGLCLERTPAMVIGVLAILKAGGAYVPLDPAYPPERLAFLMEDARVPLLLTQRHLRDRLPAHGVRVLCMEDEPGAPAAGLPTHPDQRPRPAHLAYLIYTSGSTGTPKGVAITHQSAVALLAWAHATFAPAEIAGVLASTSLCFDLSVFELFVPLTGGGAVILAENALQLPELPAAGEVTLINTVPSAMAQLLSCGALPGRVRTVNLAGEPLPERLVAQLYEQPGVSRVWDLYGPSEDTTYSTAALRAAGGPETIGRPIANTQVYLLDQRGEPVPLGTAGELYLGGAGLARGYLGRPGLTAEKFVPDSFSGEPGGRLYRTGDRARYLPDGNLEFLGRLDHQVKLRGFRIELGEIEAVLLRHPDVRECAAIVREDRPGDPRLVAYVAPEPGRRAAARELRRFLAERLPASMLPAAFVELERLPLTPNGKRDRRALPAPDWSASGGDDAAAAPATPLEEILAGIWAEVLGRERVGPHDHFFEMGGHSLLATQVVARIGAALGVELTLRAIFEAPTVARLARHIVAARSEPGCAAPPLGRAARDAALPLSFPQQRLWFVHQLEPDSGAYNIPLALRLRGPLDTTVLQRCLNEIIRRHEGLRTSFPAEAGQPRQQIWPSLTLSLRIVEVAPCLDETDEAALQRRMQAEVARPFDLSRAPLVRPTLLRRNETEHVLLLTLHHIVADGWSLERLGAELAALYTAFSRGEPSPLPELALQYADFAVWQRRRLQGERLERAVSYWKQQLAGAPPVLALPTDFPRPAIPSDRAGRLLRRLPPALGADLRRLSRHEGTTLFITLAAAFQTLLARWTGREEVVIGTDIAGRSHVEVEPLIGFFVNHLVLRADLSGDPAFRELLRRVREVTLGAYAHQELPFDRLVEALKPDRTLGATPLFQVLFVLQQSPPPPSDWDGLKVEPLTVETGRVKFDLALFVEESDAGLECIWVYRADLFQPATIARWAEQFESLLAHAVAAPDTRLQALEVRSAAEQRQERERQESHISRLRHARRKSVALEGD